MLPTVFLSLSGTDDSFVESVAARLPDALAYFYRKSFENGEKLLDAMEARVGGASIFVLFASKASIASSWVKFEIDRARLALITGSQTKILVFAIDRNVSSSDFPEWMRSYWISQRARTAADIARSIRWNLLEFAISRSPLRTPVGRGALQDSVMERFNILYSSTSRLPNVMMFAGHTGIGRRTVQKKILSAAFPALPEINHGPIFELNRYADSLDLYRALRSEIESNFTLESFAKSAEIFNNLSTDGQAKEIFNSISYFSDMGQAVTFLTEAGFFDDHGRLKPWSNALIKIAEANRDVRFCVVSNRQAREAELAAYSNVIQIRVPELSTDSTKSLMVTVARSINSSAKLPTDDVVAAIGGHPATAIMAAYHLADVGPDTFSSSMDLLDNIQDRLLTDSLEIDTLSEIERDILSLLSWVPRIHAGIIRDTILHVHKCETNSLTESANRLRARCMINMSESTYSISEPIRRIFRRLHGFGSSSLLKAFSERVRIAWEEGRAGKEFPVDVFDAMVYIFALEGSSLPEAFRSFILPSTLHDVIKQTYDSSEGEPEQLRQVVLWGKSAFHARMDESVREEILSFVMRAQCRLRDKYSALETLAYIQSKSYRSFAFLKAFYIMNVEGNLEDAVNLLKISIESGKYTRRSTMSLARCYHRLGQWSNLERLIEKSGDVDDIVILDLKIGTALAKADYVAAERLISKMSDHQFDRGRSKTRRALLIMRRDKDYISAQNILSDSLSGAGANRDEVRYLRAIAAIEAGNTELAEMDRDYLKERIGGDGNANRIAARIAARYEQYDLALASMDAIQSPTAQDKLLTARILEKKSLDSRTPIEQREILKEQVVVLRSRYKDIDEIDMFIS